MKTILSWSSGKDAAYSLHKLIKNNQKPDLLLTTVNKDFNRVSMHGLRIELLEKQAEALDLPLYKIPLDKDVDMASYNKIMSEHLKHLKIQGYNKVHFGDIFLEDLKTYRIKQMQSIQMQTDFPVWGESTEELAVKIIQSGIKAVVISVNAKLLNKNFVGRRFDENFLNDLPTDVDWCGENGEFHTFVYDSPDFKQPVPYSLGSKIFKTFKPCNQKDKDNFNKNVKKTNWDTGFWFIDVLLS